MYNVHALFSQYDAKLLKLQKQNSKTQCGQGPSSVNHEIFRKVNSQCWLRTLNRIDTSISSYVQKLQHAKAESDREIAVLKKHITDLERQLSVTGKRKRFDHAF